MTRLSTPSISVVLPTYQRAHVVADAIASVLRQTYPSFELLVVDDGSTDGTAEVVSSFKDARLKLVTIEHGGRSRARNEGAARASGEVLTFLDSDDQANPVWLERLSTAFDDPGIAGVCCGARLTTEAPATQTVTERVVLPCRFSAHSSTVGLFSAGTFAVRRTVFEAIGGYDDRLEFSENAELAIRLVMHSEERAFAFATVNEPLIWIRRRRAAPCEAEYRARFESAELILRLHGTRYRRAGAAFWASYRAVAAVNAYRLGLSGRGLRHSIAAAAGNPGQLVHWGRVTLGLVPPLARRFWTRPIEK